MRPPDFSDETKLSLAFRSCLICNNPGCSTVTVGASNTDPSLATKIGEAAHIQAARSKAARYNADMTDIDRASIENGIWLCANCHTMA
jgi:hypothetical protein